MMKSGSLSRLLVASLAFAPLLASAASRKTLKVVAGTTLYAPGIGPVTPGPVTEVAKPVKIRLPKPVKAAAVQIKTENKSADAKPTRMAPAKRFARIAAKRTPAPAPAPSASKPLSVKPGSAANASHNRTDALDDYGVTDTHAYDPLERINRSTFKLNHGIYNYLLRPVAKGYTAITPRPVRVGLDNFFENLRFPVRFVNCGLQGKFRRAGQETQKFAINSLAGVGGLIKQSDKVPSLTGVPPEDTGLTFANWGIGHGPYIVIPILGASSFRDGFGLAGDYVLNPVNWGTFMRGRNARDWTWIPPTVDTVRALPAKLDLYDHASSNAVDPYLSVRDAYLQNRAAAANQ